MTVKQLIHELAKYPDDMDVMFAEVETGFRYNPVETVSKLNISFHEEGSEDGEEPEAYVDCVVLDGF